MRFGTQPAFSSDLQHHNKEKVEICHSLELFKQCQRQESQGGVLVAVDRIVLATDRERETSTMETCISTLTCSSMHQHANRC